MRIRAVTDAKALENYCLISSLKSDTDSRTRTPKNTSRISDRVDFSQDALDKFEVWKQRERDASIQQKQLQEKKDEEIRRSFEILNLDRGTPMELVKRAYHYLMQNYHPDKYTNLPPEFRELAEVKARQIIDAYNSLAG